ncbi:hypothetical protein ACFLTE_07425 [Bacteroidota bacterium]
MIRRFIHIAFLALIISPSLISQEIDWEEMLLKEVEIENPVYKPVIGIGGGIMNYFGDIEGGNRNYLIGQPALRITVSMFADNKHYFKLNINGNLLGKVGKSVMNADPAIFEYSAFETSIFSGGANFEYNFGNFFSGQKRIRPFIAIGAEFLNFNAKGNIYYGEDQDRLYYAWDDGTIRNIDQDDPITQNTSIVILQRDNEFESSFTTINNESYARQVLSIPIDGGLDYSISDRATIRFGASFCLTSSDYLDGYKSGSGFLDNDRYLFTYTSFFYDLWSDPESILVEQLFLDITDFMDFSDLTADEDNDMVLDFSDECPNTPFGVQTDTVGCPFDDDNDGVPNYMDKELNTAAGVFVDKDGVTMSEDDLLALLDWSLALNRDDAFKTGAYRMNKFAGIENLTIPEKFKFVDYDGDGYVSFFELLQAIDEYFDYDSPLSSSDLQDLNDFFFAQ